MGCVIHGIGVWGNAGNRTSKTVYAYTQGPVTSETPTSTESYTYASSGWGDRLIADGSNTYTYDAVGNPLNYNGYTLAWNGRQLVSMTKGSKTYSYKYNDEGIRTSKIVNGVEYIYILDGSRIVSETWGDNLFVYLYDESGSPIGMQYRSVSMAEGDFYTFYYEKNLQGDIVAVYNESGTKVLAYTYDAWGNCTATSYTTAGTNLYALYTPFRYRGYYYDFETGLYYLQSRYYNPQWGRFLNADVHVNANGDLIGFNMYAYCSNNPVMGYDPTGEFMLTTLLVGAAIGAAINLVSSVISVVAEKAITNEKFTLEDAGKIAISTAIGAVEGAAIVLCPQAAFAISAVSSAADTAISGIIDGEGVGDIVVNSLISGVFGGVAGSGGSDLVKSGKLINDAVGSVGNAFRKGVHPAVKKTARKTIKKAAKKVSRAYVAGQLEDFAYGGAYELISFYTRSVVDSYTGW